MSKYIYTCLFILIFSTLFAQIPQFVQNLVVEDFPFDDGSGLVVKFEPLPKEAKIIEYRIYRGVNPDTLFYIGKIEVDARTGVPSNEVTFFDKDFRTFVDVESPKRLKHEKGQPIGSPIYQAIPRDVSIVGPMLKKFSVLSIIGNHSFYKKTQKYAAEEGGVKTISGGLKIEDFETILANVAHGNEYFYTVIAVNQRRKFQPYAPIVKGIPVDNMPQSVERLHAVWVKDKQVLNFEFELPLFIDDVDMHSVYMIHVNELPKLNEYLNYMTDLNDWEIRHTVGDSLAIKPNEVKNPGQLLTTTKLSLESSTVNFYSVNYEKDFPEIDDYRFYVTLTDYMSFESVSAPVIAKVVSSEALPFIPKHVVHNKANNKGDTIEIIIDKPNVELTHFNFKGRGQNKKKLQVAYNYSLLPDYKVKKIQFDFLDNSGNVFATVTEHFFNNIFNLTLPSESYIEEGFSVQMSLHASGSEIHQVPYLSQKIEFDDELMMLKPGNLIMDGVDIMNYRYLIMKKARAKKDFKIDNRITPLINLYDDNVAFVTYILKGISSYDAKNNHLLFDTMIDMSYSEPEKQNIITNLFYNDFIHVLNSQLAYYESILAKVPNDEEAKANLEYYSSIFQMQLSHPKIAEINKISKHKKRVNELVKLREYDLRNISYKFVKTNNEGLFTVSDVYTDEHGNEYIYPKPSWFDLSMIPTLIATVLFGVLVIYFSYATRRGKHMFIRPIAGLEEGDNAIGRATEMGRPILFVPGLTSISDVATLAGLSILGHVTRKAAEYDTRIIVPVADYVVLPIAQQIVKEAHYMAGRPDSFNQNDVFFVAEEQFAFVAGVNGIMIREKTSTNFYLGMFFAEALIMTETGNHTGAIQLAGTDAETQIPFFITTCDYTLIGEELYAASAYLARDPVIVGTLKSQDYTKLCIITSIIIGTILSTFNVTGMINWFPSK